MLIHFVQNKYFEYYGFTFNSFIGNNIMTEHPVMSLPKARKMISDN